MDVTTKNAGLQPCWKLVKGFSKKKNFLVTGIWRRGFCTKKTAPSGRTEISHNIVSSHEAAVGAHRTRGQCIALANSGIFIQWSCIKALFSSNRNRCQCAPINLKVMYTCIFVGPQSPPTVKKRRITKKNLPLTEDARVPVHSCKLTESTDMHGHSRITDAKTDVCTHTHAHRPTSTLHTRRTHEQTDLPPNTDASQPAWTRPRIWRSVSANRVRVAPLSARRDTRRLCSVHYARANREFR